ncbi:cytochrome P450 [Streptomyces sp. NPDC000618]|uniref:cytochrome P450 n=1 Tax=unclassified Streptomyces TaxID=2593676 RepID=UPI0033339E31
MTGISAVPPHLARDGFRLAPELARLRDDQPVARLVLPNGATAWLVTRHAHIREVLSDADRFGSDHGTLSDPNEGGVVVSGVTPVRHGDITQYDPPDHTRLRRMVAAGFTARRIADLRDNVGVIVSETLDTMERTGSPADLVQSFSLPIPSLIICQLLGVPYEDRAGFHERSVVRLDSTLSLATRAAAIQESRRYMLRLVARQRVRPGEGLLGSLVREHGDELDDQELAGIGDVILFGGHETTANMLALGTLLLLQNPEYIEQLKDPQRLKQVTDELLRYLSVVQTGVPRVCRHDTTIAGQRILRGERILCSLPSGNHDSSYTAGPDAFDPTRNHSAHLAFGHGVHYCLGAPLARLEMNTALPALFERFPRLRLDTAMDELEFRTQSAIYGVAALPVAW